MGVVHRLLGWFAGLIVYVKILPLSNLIKINLHKWHVCRTLAISPDATNARQAEKPSSGEYSWRFPSYIMQTSTSVYPYAVSSSLSPLKFRFDSSAAMSRCALDGSKVGWVHRGHTYIVVLNFCGTTEHFESLHFVRIVYYPIGLTNVQLMYE